jgi:hypothetical protein
VTAGRIAPLLALLLAAGAAGAAGAGAQIKVSGSADMLANAGTDTRKLNLNFRGDSPYSQIRARVFAQRWFTDKAGVFTEALYDPGSGPRLTGAYVVLNEVGGRKWLNMRAGLAPSLIGNYGLRSSYFNADPVVGVPLIWQHRTTLDNSGLSTAADMVRRRKQNVISLPMLYDACWNMQWEAMGEVGHFEYSLGITPGSMANPVASTTEPGVQKLARVGYVPVEGVRLGVSGGFGPYIAGPNRDPEVKATSYPGTQKDYDQKLVGYDAEYDAGKVKLFSEGYVSRWQAPLIAEELTASSAYVEGRYDFLPAWFGAVRAGAMQFSKITPPGGVPTAWDDDLYQVESSLTYRLARELQLRGNWQHTAFLSGGEKPTNLIAIQLRAVF